MPAPPEGDAPAPTGAPIGTPSGGRMKGGAAGLAAGALSGIWCGTAAAGRVGSPVTEGEGGGTRPGAGASVGVRGAMDGAATDGAATNDDDNDAEPGWGAGVAEDANSVWASLPPATVITPPHTEQRARTFVVGTFVGSTRKTDRHSGQVTFMTCHRPAPPAAIPRCASPPRAGCRCDGRPRTRSRGVSWRSSSFRLRVR